LDRTRTAIRTVGIYVENRDGYVFSDTGHGVATRPPVMRFGDDMILGTKISTTGAFKATGQALTGYGEQIGLLTYTLTGKVKGAVMQGSLRARLALSDPATQHVVKTVTFRTLRWMATSRAGRVFGGMTSRRDPVVVELNASGRVAKFLRIPWSASSETSNWIVPETLTNQRLAGGTASRTWSTPFTRDDGGRNTFDYALTLRVTGTKASGALQVKVTETSAAGAVEAISDSGTVKFTAASSSA
jgi:hypothetical protein